MIIYNYNNVKNVNITRYGRTNKDKIDFFQHYFCISGAGILGTIFLIVNTTLGAGLLNVPQAFDKAGGVGTSIIAQFVFLIFITSALVILASCSDSTGSNTMQDAFAALCGYKYLIFCGICVAIYSFGCCLTFLIIIGDQFDRVFATYYGLDYCHTW